MSRASLLILARMGARASPPGDQRAFRIPSRRQGRSSANRRHPPRRRRAVGNGPRLHDSDSRREILSLECRPEKIGTRPLTAAACPLSYGLVGRARLIIPAKNLIRRLGRLPYLAHRIHDRGGFGVAEVA